MVANKRSKGGTACHRWGDSNAREQRADFIGKQRRAACFAANWKHITTDGMLHDIGDTNVAESVPAHQPDVLVRLHVRVTDTALNEAGDALGRTGRIPQALDSLNDGLRRASELILHHVAPRRVSDAADASGGLCCTDGIFEIQSLDKRPSMRNLNLSHRSTITLLKHER